MGAGAITKIGKQIEVAAKNNIELRANTISSLAGKNITEKGTENGLTFGNYEEVELPPDLDIIKIVINAKLDIGILASGVKGEGFVYGIVYEIEAKLNSDNWNWAQVDQIRWFYEYTDGNGKRRVDAIKIMSEGKSKGKPESGNKIYFQLPTIDCCGCNITIKAILKSTITITKWSHYRFRWMDRSRVEGETKDRITNNLRNKQGAFLINQADTPLCGIAVIFYLLAFNDPIGYQKLALDLHRTGSARYKKFLIEPNDKSIYEMDPNSGSYPTTIILQQKYRDYRMPYVDWITMVSLRNEQNTIFNYKGEKGQEASGINYPSMVISLFESFLDFKDSKNSTETSLISPSGYSPFQLGKLKDADSALQDMYNVIFLIDSNMLDNKRTYFAPADNPVAWRFHWIVYKGNLDMNEKATTISFDYWCWGEIPKRLTISKKVFNSNFYGYVKGK